MGSCFSKKKRTPSPQTAHFPQKSPTAESHTLLQTNPINVSPPPPLPLQEENVKQVLQLSENPKPISPEIIDFPNKIEEFSEFSEICSSSETVSTVTIAERKGEETRCDEIQMLQKEKRSPAKFRRKRSDSGEFPGRTERGLKSPARKSDPLPARRPTVREVGRPRNPSGSGGFRRDRWENSGRRSRSPAKGKEVGWSPSGRRIGWSPSRDPAEKGGGKVEEGGGAPSALEKSSIEKPLVSLECFIFL